MEKKRESFFNLTKFIPIFLFTLLDDWVLLYRRQPVPCSVYQDRQESLWKRRKNGCKIKRVKEFSARWYILTTRGYILISVTNMNLNVSWTTMTTMDREKLTRPHPCTHIPDYKGSPGRDWCSSPGKNTISSYPVPKGQPLKCTHW